MEEGFTNELQETSRGYETVSMLQRRFNQTLFTQKLSNFSKCFTEEQLQRLQINNCKKKDSKIKTSKTNNDKSQM